MKKNSQYAITLLVLAILATTFLLPFAAADTDSTGTTATSDPLVAISVTPTISNSGNPGTDSGILTLTIDNIGSTNITSIEVKQYVDSITASSYNGTAFVQINADTVTATGTMSYGDLYVTTSDTCPSIITANITNPSENATWGVLTLVYATTSVDDTSIDRAVQFAFCWNATDAEFFLDLDANGDLSEEEAINVGSLPAENKVLTESRYNSTGTLTSRNVATVKITAKGTNGASFTFEQQTGAYDAGTLAVDGQILCDYVIYIPNNVAAETYTGTIDFITTPT